MHPTPLKKEIYIYIYMYIYINIGTTPRKGSTKNRKNRQVVYGTKKFGNLWTRRCMQDQLIALKVEWCLHKPFLFAVELDGVYSCASCQHGSST
jgi:hypothetical protein